jgi:hypothetical protein
VLLSQLLKLTDQEIAAEIKQPNLLRLYPAPGVTDSDGITILWAPFDYVNSDARLVIVGVTPGPEQAARSYKAVRQAAAKGEDASANLPRIKAEASFRGQVMESNLKSILEHSGLAERAGIEDIDQLWTKEVDKVHFTSTIRYPTFINRELYNNQIDSLRHPELTRYVETQLGGELSQVSKDAMIVALGSKGPRIVRHAAKIAKIDPRRVVALPHPSPSASGAVRDFLSNRRTQSIRPCRCMLCDRSRIPTGWKLSNRFEAHDRSHGKLR